jgi:UDPglucose 6-dehydrogenase
MGIVTVTYVGMTHLGLNSAVAAAARGAQVLCLDPDAALIAGLQQGVAPVEEPGLLDMMADHKDRLTYSADMASVRASDLVIVAPDVATDDDGNSDLSQLKALIEAVDQHLGQEAVLVVLSQIPPGFSRTLSLRSGRIYYCQVETLIFGRAIERALNPERIIIGAAAPDADIAPAYRAFLDMYGCPLLPMRYESAELAKIAINCCLVSSISTANMLAEICEQIGADWAEIVPSLKLDKRIGAHAYLSPGLGIAGGNLERDLNTVRRFAAQYGTDARVVDAWSANSTYRRDWVLRLLHAQLLPHIPDAKIAIWGLAYKQDTHSTKNSPSLALIAELQAFDIAAYDPLVDTAQVPGKKLAAHTDALSCCAGADILIIMTPWPAFAALELADIRAKMAGSVVIDPYGIFTSGACTKASLQHFTLGRAAVLRPTDQL